MSSSSSFSPLFSKATGLIRLFRPELPLAAGVSVVLGQLLALGALPALRQVALGFTAVFCLSAAALILNDYFDLETDRINAPQRPLPAGLVTPTEVVILSIVVTLTGLLLAALTGPLTLVVALLVWLAGFLYNWRLKQTGLPGNLLVSFSVAMTFVYGGIVVGQMAVPMLWYFAVTALLIDLGEEIAGDALDAAGDQVAGSRSLALLLGPKVALRISAVCFGLVVLGSAVPFWQGWLPWVYLLPIGLMDGMIVVAGWQLVMARETAVQRRAMRVIYLSGLAAMVLIIVMQLLG